MGDHVAIDAKASNSGPVQISDGVYDVLRQLVEKVFPGLGVFYAALAVLWGWPYTYEVGGTFAALSVLGGLLLTLARKGYTPAKEIAVPAGSYDGAVVEDILPDGSATVRLELNRQGAENILNKQHLLIKGLTTSE